MESGSVLLSRAASPGCFAHWVPPGYALAKYYVAHSLG